MTEIRYAQKPFGVSLPHRASTKATQDVNTYEPRKSATYGGEPSLFLHSTPYLQPPAKPTNG